MVEGVGLASFAGMAASDLPMGTQKLIEIARALMAKPRVLLLDEPAAGLNDTETTELRRIARDPRLWRHRMVVDHNMSLVTGIADQIIVLDPRAVVASREAVRISGAPRRVCLNFCK